MVCLSSKNFTWDILEYLDQCVKLLNENTDLGLLSTIYQKLLIKLTSNYILTFFVPCFNYQTSKCPEIIGQYIVLLLEKFKKIWKFHSFSLINNTGIMNIFCLVTL